MSDDLEANKHSFPSSTEDGPLYPPWPIPLGSDLTNDGRARGTPLLLKGCVFNYQLKPVRNALVQIWQTDSNGYYKHPRAREPDALDPYWAITEDDLDPNFQYFSATKTDPNGFYAFRTIMPRWYHVFGTDRAAHIHMKIWSEANGVFTTEVYFGGTEQESLRDRDAIYARHPGTSELVVYPTKNNDGPGVVCHRDIKFY